MKKFTLMIATAAIFAAPLLTADLAFARRGADDPIGHVRGEGAGHTSLQANQELMQLARKGADDPAGHDANDDKGGANNTKDDNSGGRRPRVPGGSGCDNAHDVAEHASCRG
jgi:hypothetical protein